MGTTEVLGSRILLHPSELHRSHRFYRDVLGLAIYRQFDTRDAPGLVFFLGNGLLERTVDRSARKRDGDLDPIP
jgi:catechol 2,3-dioxygenase-like lactoylglutathione lyase family enzyme